MSRLRIGWIVSAICCLCIDARGDFFVSSESVNARVFDISGSTEWALSFVTTRATATRLFVYDQDTKLVRELHVDEFTPEHKYTWDFTNEKGKKVKPGLYFYRIQCKDEQGAIIGQDALYRTGAQNVLAHRAKWVKDSNIITFRLWRDALVRVRVGVEDGPLVATVADWVPIEKDRAQVVWDGWDPKHSVYYGDRKDLQIGVEAISLPDNYILVCDPKRDAKPGTYSDARWLVDAVAFNEKMEPSQYTHAKALIGTIPESKAVRIELPEPFRKGETLLLQKKVEIKIHVPEMGEKKKGHQFYEVLYYRNHVYAGEEPIEKTPIIYELDPKKFPSGLSTVVFNVILGSSRVGTASLSVKVE